MKLNLCSILFTALLGERFFFAQIDVSPSTQRTEFQNWNRTQDYLDLDAM